MKSILLGLTLLFSIVSHAEDIQLQSLVKCVNGISGDHHANDGYFHTVLSQDTDLKNASLLVVSDKGAQIVKGFYNSENKDLSFVYTPIGHSEAIKSYYVRNGTIPGGSFRITGWSSFGVKESPSQSKNVSTSDAVMFASRELLSHANQRSSNIQKQLDTFDEWVRSRYTDESKARKIERIRIINEERLESKRRSIEKSMADLKNCDQVPNADIKKAANIERARLRQINEKIESLTKETESLQECVKEKMVSSGSVKQQQNPAAR